MPLVEIVPAITTDAARRRRACRRSWTPGARPPCVATDTPGFIVNRVARPFYGEALRILEEGIADCATIDWAMRELGGFRMGPFELMDFIGNDVNYAVTGSVFEAMFYDPRYRPRSRSGGWSRPGCSAGRAGRGYYDYRDGAERTGADAGCRARPRDRRAHRRDAVNEAVDAVQLRIATPDDIELAMTKGVNYPRGLLAWGDAIGPCARARRRSSRCRPSTARTATGPSPLLPRASRAPAGGLLRDERRRAIARGARGRRADDGRATPSRSGWASKCSRSRRGAPCSA